MYVVSRYCGRGRGIWTNIDNGTVDIKDRRQRVKVKVRDGIAVEETTRTKNKCTILRYGRDLSIKAVKKGNRITYQEFYDPKTLRGMKKGGLWKRQRDFTLCGSKGTLECFSTSSGACGKEVFTFDNGTIGYVAARWRKKLIVHRPSGKLWMVLKGKVCVSRYPIAEILGSDKDDFNVWRLMNARNWEMTVYDIDGTIATMHGFFKNGQKEGKWLENSEVRYYMAGVKVSRTLYEEDSSCWNPHEILKIPNAQLRCSLLNRFGYDKLITKVESKVLDSSSYDGGQLIEIAAVAGKGTNGNLDKTMRLIKVVCPSTGQTYVLRVPPDMKKFEQARQWTFGLEEEGISKGVRFDFIKET